MQRRGDANDKMRMQRERRGERRGASGGARAERRDAQTSLILLRVCSFQNSAFSSSVAFFFCPSLAMLTNQDPTVKTPVGQIFPDLSTVSGRFQSAGAWILSRVMILEGGCSNSSLLTYAVVAAIFWPKGMSYILPAPYRTLALAVSKRASRSGRSRPILFIFPLAECD
ncbi:hypothetical protein T492DRAFT_1019775 [Pavlovales sp. CCMP2436]|nr:hypothetical protein T492DRAFT_1019775 [Pavlovales sp. CCMP2436]